MSTRSVIPWTADERLNKANGAVGGWARRFGPDSPEVAEGWTEVRVVRAELAIEDLIESAPAPTAEQLDRLRSLLPPVGTTSSAAVA